MPAPSGVLFLFSSIFGRNTVNVDGHLAGGFIAVRNFRWTPPHAADAFHAILWLMAQPVAAGYTYEDLEWLRDELGVAHLELDPWGSLIVTPATDEHDAALAILHGQAVQQLRLPLGCVRSNSFGWRIPGGSGYTNVPDLTVLAPGWRRIADDHTDPPPLLVVEVASRSTVQADRGRKLDDYRLGGAGLYVRVDFYDPGRAGFEVYDLASGAITAATTAVDLVVGRRPLRFDLSDLPQG